MVIAPWLVTVWNWLVDGGFFEQGQWAPEIAGELTNDHAIGGPLDELEAEVGQSFPDLQALRQTVVDKWRAWQRSFLNRRGALDAYKESLKQFAIAFDAKKAEYQGGIPPVPIGGIGDWLKKWWPYVLAGGIAVVGIGAAIGASRKK